MTVVSCLIPVHISTDTLDAVEESAEAIHIDFGGNGIEENSKVFVSLHEKSAQCGREHGVPECLAFSTAGIAAGALSVMKKPSACCMFTLFDDMGFIVGKSYILRSEESEDAGRVGPLKLYRSEKKPLTVGDVRRHYTSGNVVYMEIKAWLKDTDKEDVKIITGKSLDNREGDGHGRMIVCAAAADDTEWDDVMEENPAPGVTFELQDGKVQVKVSKYQVESLIKTSQYFSECIQKQKSPSPTVTVDGVDAVLFRRFLEFVHYGKFIYLHTEESAATLQECCGEMWRLATRFGCHKLEEWSSLCSMKIPTMSWLFPVD